MAKRKSYTTPGEEFARPVWETIADIEADYDVEVSISFEPSPQRGVFFLTVAAAEDDGHGEPCIIESITIGFPNSGTMSFLAQLFTQLNKLARQLSDRPIRYRPTTEGERRASSLADK